MVKAVIYFTLIALSATSSILAEDTEAYHRELFEDDLIARDDTILEERDSSRVIFSREDDTASLQEREPFFFLPLLGMAARTAVQVGTRVAARAGTRVAKGAVKNHVNNNNNNNNKRKRDLELEDELDFAAREDMDELTAREVDIMEREINEDEIFEREVDEELYLD